MSDFVSYLNQKETLLQSCERRVYVAGEEQLVALYLEGRNEFNQTADIELLDEDNFENFIKNDRYIARKTSNEVSYLFDKFIEVIIWNAESRLFGADISIKIEEFERALRVIAGETRFKRRLLGEVFSSFRAVEWDRPTARLVYVEEEPENAYVFSFVPRQEDQSLEEHDNHIRAYLYGYCFRVKLVAPRAKHVVGIHIGNPNGAGGGLCYLDVSDGAHDEMLREFEGQTPLLGRVRTTKQQVNQDASFKEPGDFDKESDSAP